MKRPANMTLEEQRASGVTEEQWFADVRKKAHEMYIEPEPDQSWHIDGESSGVPFEDRCPGTYKPKGRIVYVPFSVSARRRHGRR